MKKLLQIALLGTMGIAVMSADSAMAATKNHSHPTAAQTEEDAAPKAPHEGEKPLMVVRFNQTAVPYEWPLYNTLTKALQVQPQAQFDVVSVAPRTQELNQQIKENDSASQDLAKILGTLKEIGMPENRYTVSKIYDDVKTSEVRIYIRPAT